MSTSRESLVLLVVSLIEGRSTSYQKANRFLKKVARFLKEKKEGLTFLSLFFVNNNPNFYKEFSVSCYLSVAIKKICQTQRAIPLASLALVSAIAPNALANDKAQYFSAPAEKAIQNQYIVVFKENYISKQALSMMSNSLQPLSQKELKTQAVLSSIREMSSSYGVAAESSYSSVLSGFSAKMDEKLLSAMLEDDRIEYIEQDQMMYATAVQPNATWGLDRVDQNSLPLNRQYEYNYTGDGVDMYIVDTGVLASHSDFGGRVSEGFTAINDGRGTNDCNGHGTHVAGTAGGTTWGVAKDVNLIPVRVLGCSGSGSNSGVIAGVDYVARNASGPSVANMSLGGGSSSALDRAVENAINEGVVFAVAAGNSNSDACSGSPNRVGPALTVASSTRNDARSSFSSWGRCIDIFAPGSSITSAWSNGGTNTISGTSMAAPHVAGAAALYLEANPSSTPAQVEVGLEGVAAVGKISNPNGSPNLLLQTNFDGTVTPPPVDPVECTKGITFGRMSSYSSISDDDYQVSGDGCSVTVSGNSWVMTTEGFDITSSTVITFEFSTTGTAEVQGVGFDSDSGASSDRVFQLTGTQDWGIDDYSYSGGVETIQIPVGQFYTGSDMSFVIANDKDSGTLNNTVTVSNVVISN